MRISLSFQAVHDNPVILYECYRNGTSFEAPGSLNVSAFFDGTQSNGNDIEGNLYYSSNGPSGKVTR